MKKRKLVGGGFISVTLGALGCGEPDRAAELRPHTLFSRDLSPDDSLRSEGWRKYLDATTLHAAWVPPQLSPWRPFYKPTLIAAASIVRDAMMPVHPPDAESVENTAAQTGMTLDLAEAAVFVDLPGERSVAWAGVYLRSGFQPVVTINNWPHQKGMIALQRPLGALLYYARQAEQMKPAAASRPIFILEGDRLSEKHVRPSADVFDNRFFHTASDFPAAHVFRSNGIRRIIYVNPRGSSPGDEEDDLSEYFAQLSKSGLELMYVTPGGTPGAVRPITRPTIFTPAETASFTSSTTDYNRSYSHYHSYFWSRSPGGWGYGPSFVSGPSSGWGPSPLVGSGGSSSSSAGIVSGGSGGGFFGGGSS
jgi:hypothetical protein